MKLTSEQIKSIDDFLSNQNIKYLDVRYELIDHLVSEFESNKHDNLDKFLYSKLSFILDFSKKKGKAVNWGYQKQLWKNVFSFFYKPSRIYISILIFGFAYLVVNNFNDKTAFLVLFLTFVFTFSIGFFMSLKFNLRAEKKLLSVQYVGNIMSIQFILLNSVHMIRDYLIQEKTLLMTFFFFAIIFNIAGTIEIFSQRKKILEKYAFLVN